MATIFPLLAFCLIPSLLLSCAANHNTLNKGFHLSVEDPNDVLVSPDGIFSAGFYSVGSNAYCFSVWFTQSYCSSNCTVVWMANRDFPVNGRHSKLSLLKTGDLVLSDAGQSIVWEIKTGSASSSLVLKLQDNGNLVLYDTKSGSYVWQSFDSPTDTLLPQQLFTGSVQLVSSRSQSNFSSGFYKFYFDNDNVIRLLYHGLDIASVFWPDPGSVPWEVGRTTYNSSKAAVLDSLGNFTSSDNLTFIAADYGVRLQRRLKLDFDGNLRLYSRQEETGSWDVTWQVLSAPCTVHGICGPNSVCSYHHTSGRKCSCIPGFKMVNQSDWAYGCEQKFDLSPHFNESTFLRLPHVEFYGYDFGFFPNKTLNDCWKICLERSDCKGFQLKFVKHDHPSDIPYCFAKTLLLNGQRSPDFLGDLYLKVPKTRNFSSDWPVDEISKLKECSNVAIARNYKKKHQSWSLKFLVWFAVGFGLFEILAIILVWFFLLRTSQQRRGDSKGFAAISGAGFKRFTYNELKKATNNFKEEIGRGGGGVVYKGVLSDKRVAAIKRLNEANQGEAEFLAEISTIGNLNHMNLIDMWGYCAERKCRLLVYEYIERGSLAENLARNELDWKKRNEIAVGTAEGLAYLHEECLEWVLHCDIKPQNILLDSNYNPKVSDFGLSRLISRDKFVNSSFSAIRGTRGYMAPEWVFKLPITSKVDVYSYGVVVLEMVTGKNPAMEAHVVGDKLEGEHQTLVAWIREKKANGESKQCWIKDIVDGSLGNDYDNNEMETLVEVALQCVEESSDARPSMTQVVDMLLQHEIGFRSVGVNAFYLAIWFNEPHCTPSSCAMVWTANRDFPVNGRHSKLTLSKTGNLSLTDGGRNIVWSTETNSNSSSVQLNLIDNGNLVLNNSEGTTLWQSFHSPTDTLLPGQPLMKDAELISSRSSSSFSCGYYKLFFDFDNVLRLAFVGPQVSSIYWPDPTALDYQNGRTRYNDSRIAIFNSEGDFTSSDLATFRSADFGAAYQRRLTLDFDGNLRLYSYVEANRSWSVTWQAMAEPCKIHGACGPNGICTYHPKIGRKCTCPQNFRMKNRSDWSYGCEPKFELSCGREKEFSFAEIHFVQYYGYDIETLRNKTLGECKKTCLEMCNCRGAQYQLMAETMRYNCYLKTELHNGYGSPSFNGTLFLKFPKADIFSYKDYSFVQEFQLNCRDNSRVELSRIYHKHGINRSSLRALLLCACVIGGLEIVIFSIAGFYLYRNSQDSTAITQGYHVVGSGFRRFTYAELKNATRNFSEELGRGGGAIVYKGVLSDQRIAAVKLLNGANQGAEEFLAEISSVGRLNHMNLINMWGYCAEGNHRLLVHECMEKGSLADNLSSDSLDCEKRFTIALGTARGLAYLHEECLEWVLHCDVKPQNILLDSTYQPKVADFGLSKILNRGGTNNLSISRIRGTRGYMAPEWVFNLPITSKVDVHSYGMVVLEMVTGKNPSMVAHAVDREGEVEHQSLIAWVREKKNEAAAATESWVRGIVDPRLGSDYDVKRMEILVLVALCCVEEDADARPSMSQVVEMLSRRDIDYLR